MADTAAVIMRFEEQLKEANKKIDDLLALAKEQQQALEALRQEVAGPKGKGK